MGLDMYLNKKHYVKNWSFQKPEEQHQVIVTKGGQPLTTIKSDKVKYIEEEVMYWRKANQIHGWFVRNGQERTPDVLYGIEREDLERLLEECKVVIEKLNGCKTSTKQVVNGWSGGEETHIDINVYDIDTDELGDLQPTQGFFFGSSEIDDGYVNDIQDTINFLEEELKGEDDGGEYEYYASW